MLPRNPYGAEDCLSVQHARILSSFPEVDLSRSFASAAAMPAGVSVPEGLPADDGEVSQTFAKGLAVLTAFDGAHRDMTVAEIAARVGYSRAATRRLVRTLEILGYLAVERQRYQLTPRVLRLAHGFLDSRQIGPTVAPVLRQVSVEIGEPVSFAMRDDDAAIYVAHAPSDMRMVTVGQTVGSRVPLLVSSIGRAILAHLPAETRDRLIASAPLERYTADTPTDRATIARAVEEAGLAGYALVRGEYVAGLASLSTPVFDRQGAVVGATGLVFLDGRYDDAAIRGHLVPKLQACATYLSIAF